MIFSRSIKRDKLILDFGSSNVRGLIVEKGKGLNIIKKMAVVPIEQYGVFDNYTLPNKKSPKASLGDTTKQNFNLEIIKQAAVKVIKELNLETKIRKIPTVIGLPANCLKAKLIKVSMQREKPNCKVSTKEAHSIFQAVFVEARNRTLFISADDESKEEIKFLRARILSIQISGYKVPSIVGFNGKSFDFQILVVFCQKNIWNDFKLIMDDLGLAKIQVFHEVEGLIKCDGLIKKKNTILIDVGARFTNYFVFYRQQLEGVGEWLGGGNDFSAALQDRLKISERDAQELKIVFNNGLFSSGMTERINKILTPVAEAWWSKLRLQVFKFGFFPASIITWGGSGSLSTILQTKRKLTPENVNVALEEIKVSPLSLTKFPLKNLSGKSLSLGEVNTILLSFSEPV
ncbi:MAG: hypothetical protein NTV62_01155 [Candidatus Gribaldobacteria bacterium]|nr:hypothetical protein [Candidatus Gribaldobacteria bacterium]